MWCYTSIAERTLPSVRGVLVIALLVAVGLAGCIQPHEGADSQQPAMRSIYITDAPLDVDRLDVGIAYVTVGGQPLQVVSSSFDLASLQGPEDALLVAQGMAPGGADQAVEISFAWAKATIGNDTFPVQVGASVQLAGAASTAGLLIDIDLPESLIQGEEGLRFEPVVKEVYVQDAAAGAAPAWVAVDAVQDAASSQSQLPPAEIPAADDPTVDVPPAEVPLPEAPVATTTAGEVVGWLVHFQEGTNPDQMSQNSKESGMVFVFALDSLPVAYILGTELQIQSLAGKRSVVSVEREVPVSFHDAESRQALRMPDLVNPITGLRDASGQPIDGRGVGIAVVDTGIYAAHADLLYEPLWTGGRIAMNLKVESKTFTDLPATDTTSGHGTHVAGIISSQGTSDAERRGIAPGATIYGLGVGEHSTIVWAAQAFDWILQNHDKVDPPIKVVTNSWGSYGTYNPDATLSQLTKRMTAKGITVVFSAGNEGGDGSTSETTVECQIPTPGVICVAAYDDQGTGTRNGAIASYSSRGQLSKSGTWPDVSAPGTAIFSTRPPVGSVTGFGTNLGYVELSGTSQAAPHVAGVAALMLQANPGLDPGQLEAQLKASAHKFSNGGAYSNGSHFAKGAGLVDAYAAVAAVS